VKHDSDVLSGGWKVVETIKIGSGIRRDALLTTKDCTQTTSKCLFSELVFQLIDLQEILKV